MTTCRTVRLWVALLAACCALAGCGGSLDRSREASCVPGDPTILILTAQAVPSAVLVPCIRDLPAGWSYGGSDVRSGLSRFWLDSDRAGTHAVEVSLTRTCSITGLQGVSEDAGELGVRAYVEALDIHPYQANRYFVFPGGCATYRYRFAETPVAPTLALEAGKALTFTPRSVLVALVERNLGHTLCGAQAPPCVDDS
jgi:hypothetical protein